MFNENKRGMLLASEMVKLVIAVIAIGFLAYFLSMLYFNKVAEEKGREASEILLGSGAGSVKTNLLLVNPINPVEVAIKNPTSWYFFSFTGNEKKPNSCAGKNCLCICEDVVDIFNRQIEYCDDPGKCLIIENLDPKSEIYLEIVEEPVLVLKLEETEGGILKVSQK